MATAPNSVAETIRAELEALGVENSGYAAVALVLAEGMDDEGVRLTAKTAAAKELRETLRALGVTTASACESDEGSQLDEIKAQRERRRNIG
jgi:hypothetical protein